MATIAQLVRAPGCDSGGREFESRWSPQKKNLAKERIEIFKILILSFFVYREYYLISIINFFTYKNER